MIRSVLGSRAAIGGPLGSGRGGAGNGLLTGLVAYWGLDEASGNALDKHSGGLTMTQYNSPGADTGKVYATARTFNGSSQYFSRTSETATQVGDIDFAVSLWMYAPSIGAGAHVCGRWGAAGAREFVLYQSNLTVNFYVSSNGTAMANTPNATISASTWTMITFWHDVTANTINLQINNGTPVSTSYSSGVYVGTSPFELSISGTLNKFLGKLGPVAFWKNRTLDATARAALWNGGAGLAYSAFTA